MPATAFLRDHVAVDRRADGDRAAGLPVRDDVVDLLRRDAQQLEPAAGVPASAPVDAAVRAGAVAGAVQPRAVSSSCCARRTSGL